MSEFNTITNIIAQIQAISDDKVLIFRGENEHYDTISSTLYREQRENTKDTQIHKSLDFPTIQTEIIQRAKRHFPVNTSNFEILTELQHYGGKTNLIDFSQNFLVALFFACDGKFSQAGRLICLKRERFNQDKDINQENQNNDLLLEPYSKNPRVIFQNSIFVYAAHGLLSVDSEQIISIKAIHKKGLLNELKRYCNIYVDTIYNDLQGFIANKENYKSAQTDLYLSLKEL